MIPTSTRNATTEFVKPKNWQDEQDARCGALSVRREIIGRRTYHFSTWRPTPDEMLQLEGGACVELCCVGLQPPVAVRTTLRQAVGDDRRAQLRERLDQFAQEQIDAFPGDYDLDGVVNEILEILGAT